MNTATAKKMTKQEITALRALVKKTAETTKKGTPQSKSTIGVDRNYYTR